MPALRAKVPAALTAKAGPLPRWAWLVLLLAAAGGWLYLRRRGSSPADASSGVSLVTGNGPYGAVQATQGATAGAAPAFDLSSVLPAAAELQTARAQHDYDLASLGVAARGQELDFQVQMASIASANGGATTAVQNPSMTPVPAAHNVAASFAWGGRTWYAKDRSAFGRYLTERGSNLKSWAAHHPTVASRLGWTNA